METQKTEPDSGMTDIRECVKKESEELLRKILDAMEEEIGKRLEDE